MSGGVRSAEILCLEVRVLPKFYVWRCALCRNFMSGDVRSAEILMAMAWLYFG
jgi:hypothetical protein